MLCLQETWAASDVEQLSITNYVGFHAEAMPSHGHPVAGLSTYFKMETFVHGRLVKLLSPVFWALIVRWTGDDNRGLIVVNVYAAMHTQGVQPSDFELLFEAIDDLRASNGADDIIILGDLNSDRFRRPAPARREEQLVLEYLRHLEANDYRIYPDRAVVTFMDASTTLDYVVVSPMIQVRAWKIEETLNSQHLPVVLTLETRQHQAPATDLEWRAPNLRFPPGNVLVARELLSGLLDTLQGIPTAEGLNEMIVRCFLMSGVEKRGVQCSSGSSWWKYVPSELQSKLRELEHDAQFLARHWSEGRSLFTVSEVIDFRRELNEVSMCCHRYAENALLQELRSQFQSHRLCWKVLKKLRSPDTSVAIEVGTLQRHFSTIFHRRDRPLCVTPGNQEGWGVTRPEDLCLDEPFTDEDLTRALKELNGNAGTGPQRIPSQALKDVFEDEKSRSVLLLLMNICFQEGVIPTPWGVAELFILHKGKGLLTVADNYRAIALSDDFRRVYERLLQHRIGAWSYATDATGRMQFGFKSGTGTTEAILSLRTFMFYATRVLNRPGFAVYIDLRKAFPSMSRTKIVETLRKKQAPAKIVRAVGSLLSGSMQRLKVNGRLSPPFPVTSGTPEGSINSPELFSVVYKELLAELDIHELPSDPSLIEPGKVYYVIFADDLSFLSLDLYLLGEKTSEFKARCRVFDMEMNANKTNWMAFLTPGTPSEPPLVQDWKLIVDGDEILNVDEFVYLGYKLDSFLTDEAHLRMINDRYLRAARVTGRLMRELRCTNLFNLRKFYVSMVFSQLYGLQFVDCSKVEFERGVGIFVKTSLGLPDSFPHVVACALLHVKNIFVFQLEQRMKCMIRWETKVDSPAFDAFFIDRTVLFPRGVGWNARFGEVLEDLGLLKTIDYRQHFTGLVSALENRCATDHRGRLLATEGRAFWTELGPEGHLSGELKQVLSLLTPESARIIFCLFADMLCWTALKCPTRTCETCVSKF